MKRAIIVAALLTGWAAVATAQVSINGSTNLNVVGDITANSLTITQEWTMTNGETLDNASDGIVRITANDDAATLLQLKLESDNAGANMADGDSFLISGIASDSGGAATTYAEIDLEASDVTAGTEDGVIKFNLADGANSGTLTTFLTLSDTGLAGENGDIIGNNTDAEIELLFDDDAAELGKLTLRSSNGAGNMANNDYVKLSYAANDDGGNETEYAFIEMKATDVTNTSEDGGIDFNVMVGATPTDVLQLSTTGATIPGTLTVSGAATISGAITGSSTLDADSITTDAGAGIDAQSAGILKVGEATATSVEIADAGVTTDIQGPITVLGTTGSGIDTAAGNALYIGEATATSVSIGASDADTSVAGDLDVVGRLSAGHTASYTTAGPTDNVDVGSVNTIFIDGSAALVTIGGFANGVAGQYLMLVSVDTTNGFAVENNEGGGSQDIFTSSEADVTIATKGGGMLLVCDGTSWYECD